MVATALELFTYQPTRPPEIEATKQKATRPSAIHAAMGTRRTGISSIACELLTLELAAYAGCEEGALVAAIAMVAGGAATAG